MSSYKERLEEWKRYAKDHPEDTYINPQPDADYKSALRHIAALDDEDFLNVLHRALLDRPGVAGRLIEPENGCNMRFEFQIAPITYDGDTTPARDVTIQLNVRDEKK